MVSRQISIGSVRFALNLIQKQEEYDVLLEVPDMNDEKEVHAKINAKIQFIWSLHKFYSDELVKSEERFNNIKNLIYQKQNILKNLNGMLLFLMIFFGKKKSLYLFFDFFFAKKNKYKVIFYVFTFIHNDANFP